MAQPSGGLQAAHCARGGFSRWNPYKVIPKVTAGTALPHGEFTRGWRPLAAAVVGVTCGASPVPFNVLPLVMGPIHAELHWDFAAISAGMTCFGVLAALLAPLYGALSDRFGVRQVALVSLLAFALTFASFHFISTSLVGYWALWTMLGLVGIGSTPVTFSRAINMWFHRNRGFALGTMLLGTSLSAMIVPQIAHVTIEHLGWRMVFPVVAILPLCVALPIGLAWFREPRPHERPAQSDQRPGTLTGLTLGQAVRGHRFWVLQVAVFGIAFAYAGVQIHMAEIVGLHHLSSGVAAGMLSVVAVGMLASRLAIGYLFDRLWAPAVSCPALCLAGLGCWLVSGTASDLTAVVAGAFLLGCAAGAESDIIAYFAARYFGMAHYGRIYGMLYMSFGIASSLSAIAYGAVRDRTGGYDPILLLSMALFIGGGLLLLTLGRYPAAVATDLPLQTAGALES